jgi:hypothetical protein
MCAVERWIPTSEHAEVRDAGILHVYQRLIVVLVAAELPH